MSNILADQTLVLDRSSRVPLYQQIADAIRLGVHSGRLSEGVKLPSTRAVAKALGVHRRTVVQAFELLEAEGWVTTGIGQGTFAGRPSRASQGGTSSRGSDASAGVLPEPDPREPRPATASDAGTFSWHGMLRHRGEASRDFWRAWTQGRATPGMIRFTGATADPSFFPAEDFRTIMDEVFRARGQSALDYGPTEGHGPLREWVAERLQARGVQVEADQVLIVNGSQQGLDLMARLLLREGDTALVEEPGYTNGFRLFQGHGARVLGLPMDDGGLRLDVLERVCSQERVRLLYLMPIFQNPTGLSLEEPRIGPVLETCSSYRVPIIEDQFDADLFYEGEPPWPVKSHDSEERVVLLGSFSKILFPGFRLGWLVVPRPLLAPLRELKQMSDFSSGLLAQYAVELYCRRGLLDLHLARVRELYGARMRVMLEALALHFPPSARWTQPRGGLTLWVQLPEGLDSLELLQQARREGVDFSPGPLFFPNGGGSGYLRLSYIRETEERIRRGVEILGSLIVQNLTRVEPAPVSGPFF